MPEDKNQRVLDTVRDQISRTLGGSVQISQQGSLDIPTPSVIPNRYQIGMQIQQLNVHLQNLWQAGYNAQMCGDWASYQAFARNYQPTQWRIMQLQQQFLVAY